MPDALAIEQYRNRGEDIASRELRRGKSLERAKKSTGTSIQVGGVATQATGKGMRVAGKGMQVAGKASRAGGSAMIEAGTALSSTGLGAVVGVPLALAGATAYGAGAVADGAGKITDTVGKRTDSVGRAVRKSGSRVKGKGTALSNSAKLKASQIADKALKKIPQVAIASKIGGALGVDVMKWFKIGIVLMFVLEAGFYVAMSIMVVFLLTHQWLIFKAGFKSVCQFMKICQ